jgi:hypothetical protein
VCMRSSFVYDTHQYLNTYQYVKWSLLEVA